MGRNCLTATVDKVSHHHCWYADSEIVEGAVECLMVDEFLPDWCRVGRDN